MARWHTDDVDIVSSAFVSGVKPSAASLAIAQDWR